MKSLQEYVDMIKTETGSDYSKAKELSITKQSMSTIRHGGGIKDVTAVKLAKIIGIDEKEVLLAAMIARTSDKDVMKVLENISKNLGIAASVFLAVGMIQPTLLKELRGAASFVDCILC